MNVNKLISRNTLDVMAVTRSVYYNKYFNMFISKYKPKSNITNHELEYVLKRFWYEGQCLAFMAGNKEAGIVGYSRLTASSWDMYDFILTARAINTRGIKHFYPEKELVVGKDCVIGYYAKNHRPAQEIVNWYIDRIVQVETLLQNNLALQNLPFIVSTDAKNKNKMEDIISKILNNEIVIYTDADITQALNVLQTASPLIIKDLYDYKVQRENELLTYLGLNNNPYEKKERLVTDEVNSNNQVIDYNDEIQEDSIVNFFKDISEVLGVNIEIENLYDMTKEETPTAKDKEGEQDDKDNE